MQVVHYKVIFAVSLASEALATWAAACLVQMASKALATAQKLILASEALAVQLATWALVQLAV